MNAQYKHLVISDDKSLLDLKTIHSFLSRSYWANKRSRERIVASIENSVCFGVYDGKKQIGFARVVTDDATMYWLADLFIDEDYRGQGIGKALVNEIVTSDRFKDLMGILGTKDAHDLYEAFHFVKDEDRFMRRMPDYVRKKVNK